MDAKSAIKIRVPVTVDMEPAKGGSPEPSASVRFHRQRPDAPHRTALFSAEESAAYFNYQSVKGDPGSKGSEKQHQYLRVIVPVEQRYRTNQYYDE
jgi:hypothetical protein